MNLASLCIEYELLLLFFFLLSFGSNYKRDNFIVQLTFCNILCVCWAVWQYGNVILYFVTEVFIFCLNAGACTKYNSVTHTVI